MLCRLLRAVRLAVVGLSCAGLLSAAASILGGLAPATPAHAQNAQVIEILSQAGHSTAVNSVAVSSDGRYVVSGSTDKTVKLWDLVTGKLIRTFTGHSEWVHAVAFLPGGRQLVSGSADKTIKLWDAATGALLRTFEGHSGVVASVAISPDGLTIVSGSWDGTAKLWELATGIHLRTFAGHTDWLNSVAFSPDARRIVSASRDKTIKLWDLTTAAALFTLNGHSGDVKSVAFSPDGATAVSAGHDYTVRIWDMTAGKLLRTLSDHTDFVESVAFSPDGHTVASGSGDDTIRLWDASTGKLRRTIREFAVRSVAFSAGGREVIAGGTTVSQWDTTTGERQRTFTGRYSGASVAFSPDKRSFISGAADDSIMVWDLATGRVLRALEGHTRIVTSAVFSSDGRKIVSGSSDMTVKLWDAATGHLQRTIETGITAWYAVAVSPDGHSMARGSEARPRGFPTLGVWDLATGKLLRTFEGHSRTTLSVVFSPDGRSLVSGGDGGGDVKVWDLATSKLRHTFEGNSRYVHAVAISPDGQSVVSAGADKTVKLWNMATGRHVRTFEGHADQVVSVAFSLDGRTIASGSDDNTGKLWDIATGKLLHTLEARSGSVASVAFSSDGHTLATGSRDGTIQLWSLATGQSMARFLARNKDEWLSLVSAGFFASSARGADAAIHIVRGLDATTISQVHQSLYNPDLVREALAGDPKGEVAAAAQVINLEKVLDSGPSPDVAITAIDGSNISGGRASDGNDRGAAAAPASTGPTTTTDLVTVSGRITDRGKGIGRIEWRVNGITAAIADKPARGSPNYDLTQSLALDPGPNTIELVAYNGSNLLASVPARAKITFNGAADSAKPKLHIFAVGINAYVDSGWTPPGTNKVERFGPLSLAVKDAETFAADMKRAATPLFGEGNVNVVPAMNANATRENLEKIIDGLADKIHPRDTFILFVAGHGTSTKLDGRFYIIPQDYNGGEDPAALKARAIGQDHLQRWLANRIKAKRALILLDTCESGALVGGHARSRTDGQTDGQVSEAAIGRLHEATGRPVLTAAATGQFAYEDSDDKLKVRHGLFTWALLEGLRKAQADADGNIRLSALVAHVQDRVPKLAAELGGRGSTKSAGGAGAAASPGAPQKVEQSARFGSRGEDFVLARRLQ